MKPKVSEQVVALFREYQGMTTARDQQTAAMLTLAHVVLEAAVTHAQLTKPVSALVNMDKAERAQQNNGHEVV